MIKVGYGVWKNHREEFRYTPTVL